MDRINISKDSILTLDERKNDFTECFQSQTLFEGPLIKD